VRGRLLGYHRLVQAASSTSPGSVLASSASARAAVRTLVALGTIFLVALALRALWIAHTGTIIPWLSDPQYYHATATNIAEGRGFSVALDDRGFATGPASEATAFWPPGFPLALAPFYKLFGPEPAVAKAFNAVAGALAVLPVFVIGSRLRGGACGLLAAAIYALTPALIFWTPSLFSEPLFTLGVAATLAIAMLARDRGSWPWLLATGFTLAATSFVRSQGLLLVLPVAVLVVPRPGVRAAARALVLVAAVLALCIVPWAVRNQAVMGRPYLINDNLGYNLRLSHAPYATGTSVPPQDLWDEQPGISFKQRERLFDTLGRRRAVSYALHHPAREAQLAVKRVLYLGESDAAASIDWSESLGRTPVGSGRDVLVAAGDGYWYALLALAAVSLVLVPRSREWWALWSSVAVWIALHTVFAGEPRYHVPLVPVLACLAAAAVLQAIDRIRARAGPDAPSDVVERPVPPLA